MTQKICDLCKKEIKENQPYTRIEFYLGIYATDIGSETIEVDICWECTRQIWADRIELENYLGGLRSKIVNDLINFKNNKE